jgi:hypothetical protein
VQSGGARSAGVCSLMLCSPCCRRAALVESGGPPHLPFQTRACLPQIAKLLIIPFVAIMEMVWFKRRFTPPVAASMVVVVIGVSIV